MKYNPEDISYEFSEDISIEDIKQYFMRYNNSGPFFSIFETGLNNHRFDLIRVNPWQRQIRIFEFKSSRQDFISDKKWQNYLKYCHTFTFVSARKIINKCDVPKGIGLLWIFKWAHRIKYDDTIRKWRLGGEWIQKPRKMKVLPNDMLDVAFILCHRVVFRKDDFF